MNSVQPKYGFAALLAASTALVPIAARAETSNSNMVIGVSHDEHVSKYRLGIRPQAFPADSSYFLATFNQYTFIGAFYQYNALTCAGGNPPQLGTRGEAHGTVAFGPNTSVTLMTGTCAGHAYTAATLYYQWTDGGYSATQDFFQVLASPGGILLPTLYDFVASIDSTTPDKQLGKPKCPCGDPINVASGNVYEAATDYESAGTNRLSFTRSYNSNASPATLAKTLGLNWRSNFDRYLQVSPAGGPPSTVLAERSDGQIIQFSLVGGIWTPDSDISATLVLAGTTWTLTAPDDTVETYTGATPQAAQLTQIVQRGGYGMNLAYNASGELATVTDIYNRTLTFAYTGGLLSALTTPDNQTIQYGTTSVALPFGPATVLGTVTYPTSPASVVTYQYGVSSLGAVLTGIIDENGNPYTTWSYDAYSRGISSTHAGGVGLTTVAYNDADGSRIVTNALGVQDTYAFAQFQGIPKVTGISRAATGTTAAATETFTYDANGYEASGTDWNGNLTTYTNNLLGEPTQVVEASGTGVARTTITNWATSLHVPLSVATQGLTTSYTYDAAGNQATRTDNAAGLARTWTTVWSSGLPMSIAGPRTDIKQVTQFSYGNFGALSGIKDAAGHVTQIPSSTPGGLPLKMVDPNGVATTFAYDPRQRLLASRIATSAGARTTSYVYDPAGNLIKKTLPDGSFDMKTYDQAHRLIADTNALHQTASYTLDALGDRLMSYFADSTGKTTWQVADNFDALGRRIQETKGAGQTSSFAYDPNGNLVTEVDGRSLQTTNSYDALDRLSQAKDPAGGLTTYTYDQHDRITQVIAPNGATTGYVFDGYGRAKTTSSPDTGTTTAAYDLADNLIASTDGAGIVTNNTYDALNRPTSTTFPSDPAENVAETYDQKGPGFGIGRLTSVTDAVGSLSYTYDERANRLSEARTAGSLTLTTSYAYDKASRLAGVLYPSGTATGFTYDLAGQPSSVVATTPGATKAVTLATGFAWKPFGPLAGVTYGDGGIEIRGYDLAYRLGSITNGGLQNLAYGYDGDDNATAIMDAVTAANSHALTYDNLNRVSTDKPGGGGMDAFGYDLSGNRISSTGTGYTYAPNSNVLTGYATPTLTTTVSSNGVGSITAFTPAAGAATKLGYNAAERLASVQVGAAVKLANIYDAFGRRMLKTAGKVGTVFQYDPAGHVLEERDTTGAVLTRQDTVYLGGTPLAEINPGTGAIYFLHTDHLGAPQVATTTQGAVAWQGTYTIFGSATAPAGLLTQNLRLPGQFADTTTGYSQNGYRDYYPALGRYLESDPIGLAAGINTYAYVGSNPTNYIDPLGLAWIYDQSTGILTHTSNGTEDYQDTGYAGRGTGLNNPGEDNLENTGPLPAGHYTIGDEQDNVTHGRQGRPGHTLRDSMRLTPDPRNNMHGRSGFLIHNDNGRGNHSASNGCIAISHEARDAIDASGDNNLQVVPSND